MTNFQRPNLQRELIQRKKNDYLFNFHIILYQLTKFEAQSYITSRPKGNDCIPENNQVFLNSSLVSKRFFLLVKDSQLCSPNSEFNQWL